MNNGTPYGMGGVSISRGLSLQSRREGGGGFLSRYRTDRQIVL